jgi:hypothetical protein
MASTEGNYTDLRTYMAITIVGVIAPFRIMRKACNSSSRRDLHANGLSILLKLDLYRI